MKKAFIVALGVITTLVLTGCTLFYPNWGNPDGVVDPTPSASTEPTESSNPDDSPTPSPSESPSLSPALLQILYTDTSAGVLNVVAEVTNFAEDGGTCTLNYYKDSLATPIGTVRAERNVTTTQCFPFNVDFTSLPKGSIELTVVYKSENHLGESDKFEVIIP
jgi:hypothetical protein